jgi:hypothetical protein
MFSGFTSAILSAWGQCASEFRTAFQVLEMLTRQKALTGNPATVSQSFDVAQNYYDTNGLSRNISF